jgi:hypothetical protein
MDTETLNRHTSLLVPSRFHGPPDTANGGWLAGRLASVLAELVPEATAEVTLRAPTPLARELTVTVEEDAADGPLVRLLDDETLLAEARPASSSPLAPRPVNRATAAKAVGAYVGWWDHPYPQCFVCGHRDPRDGLCIFPGPVGSRPGVVAGLWAPTSAHAGLDGIVPTELVWAALDCPTGWAHMGPGDAALLGRFAAKLHRPVLAGEEYVVMARNDGRSGRKLLGRSAVYTASGELVAVAQATWIDVTGR